MMLIFFLMHYRIEKASNYSTFCSLSCPTMPQLLHVCSLPVLQCPTCCTFLCHKCCTFCSPSYPKMPNCCIFCSVSYPTIPQLLQLLLPFLSQMPQLLHFCSVSYPTMPQLLPLLLPFLSHNAPVAAFFAPFLIP